MEWHQELICPYCWNAQDSDYWEPGVGRLMPVAHKCEHCGEVFGVYTKVTTVFSTEKLGNETQEKRRTNPGTED